jgi:hypothetical protein
MSDNILENGQTAIISASEARSMSTWTDEKKDEFVKTFKLRTEAALYILATTAGYLHERGVRRRFLSGKHEKLINEVVPNALHHDDDSYYKERTLYGGRTHDEITEIASKRADEILANLPPLKQALNVIDTATAKMIDEHEALQKKLQVLKDTLDDLSGAVDMSDMDQKMTIGEFRKHINDIKTKKKKLLAELSEGGAELQKLDVTISKNLYSGIPGLSDALIKVINEHYERITALRAVTRRVEEKVKFGDSPEAVTLLEHFEKDEVEISTAIKAEFDAALQKLNLSKKQLSGKKQKGK